MDACTEMFVSATTCEPRSDREKVKNGPPTFSIFPIERNGFLGILFFGTSFGLTIVRQLKLARRPSLVWAALLFGLCQASLAQDYDLAGPDLTPPATQVSGGVTLYQNVRIFDGKSAGLSTPSNVLVRGNTIERISVSPITVDTNTNVRVIAADGRVLMPGLIGELMALSGFINPYPGKLGVVEEGALADLLLVDGNPLENIKLVADPDKSFLVIMKDGIIYKNTLPK
jgi:hypothetical protein